MLEKEIPKLEEEKKKLEQALNSGTADYEFLKNTSDRISEILKLLEEKETRWLELSEYI